MTSDPIMLFFLVLHVITAGFWVSQFVAEQAVARVARMLKGKPGEAAALAAQGRVATALGSSGGLGVLITGLVLTYGFHYGILSIGGVRTPGWLAIMQLVYVVALLIFVVVVGPGARKVGPLLGQAAAAGQPVPADAQAQFDRLQLASRLVNLLVLINMFVGILGVNGGILP